VTGRVSGRGTNTYRPRAHGRSRLSFLGRISKPIAPNDRARLLSSRTGGERFHSSLPFLGTKRFDEPSSCNEQASVDITRLAREIELVSLRDRAGGARNVRECEARATPARDPVRCTPPS
jgi:hypothetical protein